MIHTPHFGKPVYSFQDVPETPSFPEPESQQDKTLLCVRRPLDLNLRNIQNKSGRGALSELDSPTIIMSLSRR